VLELLPSSNKIVDVEEKPEAAIGFNSTPRFYFNTVHLFANKQSPATSLMRMRSPAIFDD
jgi:hypothetical protein